MILINYISIQLKKDLLIEWIWRWSHTLVIKGQKYLTGGRNHLVSVISKSGVSSDQKPELKGQIKGWLTSWYFLSPPLPYPTWECLSLTMDVTVGPGGGTLLGELTWDLQSKEPVTWSLPGSKAGVCCLSQGLAEVRSELLCWVSQTIFVLQLLTYIYFPVALPWCLAKSF